MKCGYGTPLSFALVLVGLMAGSWWSFAGMWRGALVTEAGLDEMNGFYLWDERQSIFAQAGCKAMGGWSSPFWSSSTGRERVPDAFALGWMTPEFVDSHQRLLLPVDAKKAPGVWGLGSLVEVKGQFGSKAVKLAYVSDPSPVINGQNLPPGGRDAWSVYPDLKDNAAAASSLPWVRVCARAPQQETLSPLAKAKKKKKKTKKEGITQFLSRPATALLLLLNLGGAYYLWSQRIDPASVSISYEKFVGGEYWRAITASFSHFELMHLGFNMMSLWNLGGLEASIGSFPYLYLSVDLVITTILAVVAMQHLLITKYHNESYRTASAVGYSCVLFSLMTYTSVANRTFCPVPFAPSMCFDTFFIPNPLGLELGFNVAPFVMLVGVQFIMPRAGFIGHLAGIVMGYPLVWGMLNWLTTPLLSLLCSIAMLQAGDAWPWRMRDYNVLLEGWRGGNALRVRWTVLLGVALSLNALLAVLSSLLLPPGLAAATALLSALGWTAYQAAKCCCCPDSVTLEHRCLLRLLKMVAFNAALLAALNLVSIGAVLGKRAYLEGACGYGGVGMAVDGGGGGSGLSGLGAGLAVLLGSVVVQLGIVVCCGGNALGFREGQALVSWLGLNKLVVRHNITQPFEGAGRSIQPANVQLQLPPVVTSVAAV